MRAFPLIILLVAAASAADTPSSGGQKVVVQRQQPLPGPARSFLKKRMARHGSDLERLLSAVISLDHDGIARTAERFEGELRIARPGADTDSFNALFPEEFFALQDALHDEAAGLRTAALAHDDARISESFGHLAATCVSCHSLYKRMPASQPATPAP